MRLAPVVRRHLDVTDTFDQVFQSQVCLHFSATMVFLHKQFDVLLLDFQDDSASYLKDIKDSSYCIGQSSKTWPRYCVIELQARTTNFQYEINKFALFRSNSSAPRDDDVVCTEADDASKPERRSMRVKFLKFCENYRPAYYGTWRKKTKFLGPRRPFGRDTVSVTFK